MVNSKNKQSINVCDLNKQRELCLIDRIVKSGKVGQSLKITINKHFFVSEHNSNVLTNI